VRRITCLLAGLVSIALAVPDATSAAPPDDGLASSAWPMFQHDARHTGRSPFAGPKGRLKRKWRVPVEGTPGSPAIAADGTIYLPSGNSTGFAGDTRGFLNALNPNGTLRWRFEFGRQPEDAEGYVQMPGLTTPAVAADGTIYVHTEAGTTDPNSYAVAGPSRLYAINPDGTPKWSYAFNNGLGVLVGGAPSSPAVGPDHTIYVGSMDTGLYALSPEGSRRWVVSPEATSIGGSPAVALDGTIYVSIFDLHAYSPEGTEKWVADLGDGCCNDASPSIGPGGTIYACGIHPDTCSATSPSGAFLWDFPVQDPEWTPAVGAAGTIFVSANDAGLYAIHPNGAQRWRYYSGDVFDNPQGSAVVDAAGRLFLRGDFGALFVVNANGKKGQVIDAPGEADDSNAFEEVNYAIGSDGTLYVPDQQALAAYTSAPDPNARPGLRLALIGSRRLRTRNLKLGFASCQALACGVVARATLSVPRSSGSPRQFTLPQVRAILVPPYGTAPLNYRLSKAMLAAGRTALGRARTPTVRLDVRATPAVGREDRIVRTIKLTR
jgi:large repetitive protein